MWLDGNRKQNRNVILGCELHDRLNDRIDQTPIIDAHEGSNPRSSRRNKTALNLFAFRRGRLPINLELACVGAPIRRQAVEEQGRLVLAFSRACGGAGFDIERPGPTKSLGGRWQLQDRGTSLPERVEVDIEARFRPELFQLAVRSPTMGSADIPAMRVHDDHESTAAVMGLALSRRLGRDLWDSREALKAIALSAARLRPALVVYGVIMGCFTQASSSVLRVSPDDSEWDIRNWTPHAESPGRSTEEWIAALLTETRAALGEVLPLTVHERDFIRRVRLGRFSPELLTEEPNLQDAIRHHSRLRSLAAKHAG